MKRPKDMTDEEREALPERDLDRVMAEAGRPMGGIGFGGADIAVWWDQRGVGWAFGRYADGSWYKT